MMIRPVDQARLLFLYLLRSSSAALAVVNKECGQISLRVARKSDIPMIQRCNLANLPENYSNQFYTNHIRQWPDLALVAEHIPNPQQNNNNNNRKPKSSGVSWSNGLNQQLYSPNDDTTTEEGNEIIGYVLGKVEDTLILPPNGGVNSNNNNVRLPRSVVMDDDDEDMLSSSYRFPQKKQRVQRMGHVTSLAVMKPFRRRGVAAELMRQLHYHMQECYPSTAGVGLHVRVSNAAACRLYQRDMGYKIEEVIPGYYQDGEDAFFMKKDLFNHKADYNHNYPVESSSRFNSAQQPLSMYSSSTPNSSNNNNNNPTYASKNRLLRMRRAMSYLTPWSSWTATNAHSANNAILEDDDTTTSNRKPWQNGPAHLRLPRTLKDNNDDDVSMSTLKQTAKVTPTTTTTTTDIPSSVTNNHDDDDSLVKM